MGEGILAMHLLLVEDEGHRLLRPITFTRPVYELRTGFYTLRERISRVYEEEKIVLHSRSYLKDVVREYTDLPVNIVPSGDVLIVNGRAIIPYGFSNKVKVDGPPATYVNRDGEIVVIRPDGKTLEKLAEKISEGTVLNLSELICGERIEVDVHMIKYLWDTYEVNEELLVEDFKQYEAGIYGHLSSGVVTLGDVYVAEGAEVDPGVILDGRHGPVFIDKNARIMHNAVIIGPTYIGEKCTIKVGAKIYENTSLGKVCKVGGEVDAVIFQSYSNKQHEGFIGHAYIGEWVNIGADTNNSDLKNTYGTVKVYVDGEPMNTGKLFVGVMIGDHTKTGINTMFNTGTVVGVAVNVYGAGYPPKYIPSFLWGGAEGFVEHRFDKAVETARRMMARRDVELTPAYEKMLRKIYEMTASERQKLIEST
ncbi:hypothetical protein B6U74_02055 [Candidatus Bathyarchaeota archaeon ex4484_205]|nr:MAG: hypothetical protein B6U74_02055 [Candidatus Bathyarchaeota archaeon ex4484_205]